LAVPIPSLRLPSQEIIDSVNKLTREVQINMLQNNMMNSKCDENGVNSFDVGQCTYDERTGVTMLSEEQSLIGVLLNNHTRSLAQVSQRWLQWAKLHLPMTLRLIISLYVFRAEIHQCNM